MKGLVFKDLLLMKKINKKVIFVMYFFDVQPDSGEDTENSGLYFRTGISC